MNKAVFLDRDGVINLERGGAYTFRKEDFTFCNEIFEALKIMQKKGFMLIVITNQSGISKGLYSHQDVNNLHNYMIDEFKKQGIEIIEVYYSPHHPEVSESISRKPDSVMIEKAIARYQIDPSKSYMIGDRERDIQAAAKCGIKTFLIESNESILPLTSQMV